MYALTQVEPVTQLQRNYQVVIDKLQSGPVVLSKSGRAAAVVLSVEEYDRQVARLRWFERQMMGDQAVAADEWVTDEEVTAEFARMGIG